MEKKRINIVCILLLFLFAFAVFDNGTRIVKSVANAMMYTKDMKGMEKVYVKLLPHNGYQFAEMPDCISPAGPPYQLSEIKLAVPRTNEYRIVSSILLLSIAPVILFMLFWAPYSFLHFIKDIKRERIFIRKNAKRLRIIGTLFLILGTMINTLDALDYFYLLKGLNLEIPGYEVVKFEFHYAALMAAFLFYLFAGIFSLGVRMKEEQDLTV